MSEKKPPLLIRVGLRYYEWWAKWVDEELACLMCFVTGALGVFILLPLLWTALWLPASVAHAHARASVYSKVTGHEITTWEAYWVGDIPALDVQIREKLKVMG